MISTGDNWKRCFKPNRPIPPVAESVFIKLTEAELLRAATESKRRIDESVKNGAKHTNQGERTIDTPKVGLIGTAGELAVANYFGLKWTGRGKIGEPDVGGGVFPLGVRTTDGPCRRLIVQEKDPDDELFVLVWGVPRTFVLCGYALGEDCKKEKYWADPTGDKAAAFFVWPEDLKPLSILWPGIVTAKRLAKAGKDGFAAGRKLAAAL